MTDTTEISRRAWNAMKLETQPVFDELMRSYALELEDRAQAVMDTGIAEEGDSNFARFDQQVKQLLNGQDQDAAAAEVVEEVPAEPQVMAMAAPIPEDVKEELVEEVVEEKPKKKREPKLPKAPKTIKPIKKAAPRKPVLVKKATTKVAVAKKK